MSTLRPSRESVERRERLARATAARARRDRGRGLVLIALGVAVLVTWFVPSFVLWVEGSERGVLDGVGAVVVPVTLLLVTRGRRIRAAGAEHVLTEDTRAPILYLRPFDADSVEPGYAWSSRVRIAPLGGIEKTYEERIARTLRKVGPFVAIGDPTERLPLLGAARVYAADEEWQAKVGELTARAGAVVMHAGESEGLTWELRHVIALDDPGRLIVSLPLQGKRKAASRQERYDGFRRRFGDAFPQPLPERIGECQFLYFDADWTPRLLGERGAPPPAGDGTRAEALRRLARDYKLTWAPLWARTLVYSVPFVALFVIVAY
jgi:hypothetical protein